MNSVQGPGGRGRELEVTARVGQVDLNEPSARTRGKGKRVGGNS